ncbi:hypothetical protein FRB94_000497 [Tulasnella sp. JGI-2019a]|nr:hypothetical protein FRB93_010555 [Tulasnella sp. JGI-2019a]KAG9006662.1 hypothetical protein FRB94_000497 [Tulasnella sp. JGI-2019a]
MYGHRYPFASAGEGTTCVTPRETRNKRIKKLNPLSNLTYSSHSLLPKPPPSLLREEIFLQSLPSNNDTTMVRLCLAVAMVPIALITEGLAAPGSNHGNLREKLREEPLRWGNTDEEFKRTQGLLKSDTPINAAYAIRNLFLVSEGTRDGPIEQYEKQHAPEWKTTRDEVPPISETMKNNIERWVDPEVDASPVASPRAIWWLLQLLYPANKRYIHVSGPNWYMLPIYWADGFLGSLTPAARTNIVLCILNMNLSWDQLDQVGGRHFTELGWMSRNPKSLNFSPKERVAAFSYLPHEDQEDMIKTFLGRPHSASWDQQWMNFRFTLKQAEEITKVIVLNSGPESKVEWDFWADPHISEDCAASGEYIAAEFKKLPERLQVVLRELSELTTTEETWNRILEITG